MVGVTEIVAPSKALAIRPRTGLFREDSSMRGKSIALITAVLAAGNFAAGQTQRPPSPAGNSAAQVGGTYVEGRGALRDITDPKVRVLFATKGPLYQGGKWIEITSGRPLKRNRDLWGSGEDYGKALYAGAPIWRAGANVSTRLKTELPLMINGKRIPVGDYSLFIELKSKSTWTLVVSTWAPQTEFYDPNNKEALWGAYGYTPDKDIARAPMKLETLSHAIEQLTWNFADMSDSGGLLTITWDRIMASVAFKVAG